MKSQGKSSIDGFTMGMGKIMPSLFHFVDLIYDQTFLKSLSIVNLLITPCHFLIEFSFVIKPVLKYLLRILKPWLNCPS